MSTQSYRPSPLHPVELVDDAGQALLDFGRHSYFGIPGPTLAMLLVFVAGGIVLGRLRAGWADVGA